MGSIGKMNIWMGPLSGLNLRRLLANLNIEIMKGVVFYEKEDF